MKTSSLEASIDAHTTPNLPIGMVGFWPSAIVVTFVAGLYLFSVYMFGISTSGQGIGHQLPKGGIAVAAASIAVGHVLDCALILCAIMLAMMFWRSRRLTRVEIGKLVRAMAIGHVPLLVWLVVAVVMWLPRTMEAVSLGVPATSLYMNGPWMAAATGILLLKQLSNCMALFTMAFVSNRALSLRPFATICVVVAPAVTLELAEYLFVASFR